MTTDEKEDDESEERAKSKQETLHPDPFPHPSILPTRTRANLFKLLLHRAHGTHKQQKRPTKRKNKLFQTFFSVCSFPPPPPQTGPTERRK
jgi:hypothetical protein